MLFVILGIVAFALKLAGFGPLAALHWWWFAAPFVAAIIWWKISDALGLTERLAMKRLWQRKMRRQDEAMEALGMKPQQARRLSSARARAAGAEAPEASAALNRGEAKGSEARAERKLR